MTSSINMPDVGAHNFTTSLMYQRAFTEGLNFLDNYAGVHPIELSEVLDVLTKVGNIVVNLAENDGDRHIILEADDGTLCQVQTGGGGHFYRFLVAGPTPWGRDRAWYPVGWKS